MQIPARADALFVELTTAQWSLRRILDVGASCDIDSRDLPGEMLHHSVDPLLHEACSGSDIFRQFRDSVQSQRRDTHDHSSHVYWECWVRIDDGGKVGVGRG